MKKKISIALAAFAFALLLVVGSVAGTIAYLTSKTGVVKNTFTVGNVAITLDETVVDVYGVAADATAKTTTGNAYKLIPGHTYTKDPTIHVTEGSESCYLFVKIENGISGIEVETADTTNATIAEQLAANGWTLVNGQTDVYAYSSAVDARTEAKDVTVFTSFTLADNAVVTGFNGTVTVQAYAVQSDGFTDSAEAWTLAPCTWGATNP